MTHLEALREALKPFGYEASKNLSSVEDGRGLRIVYAEDAQNGHIGDITAGDLRRAREALTTAQLPDGYIEPVEGKMTPEIMDWAKTTFPPDTDIEGLIAWLDDYAREGMHPKLREVATALRALSSRSLDGWKAMYAVIEECAKVGQNCAATGCSPMAIATNIRALKEPKHE